MSVSADIPDWSRETPQRFWGPGQKLLLAIRRYQYWRGQNGMVPAFFRKWLVLRHRFWTVVSGAEIPLSCRIGGGLMIPHPNGIVIHPEARIGVNCLIFQQVTICDGVDIAGHVDIGAGAKINGNVRIGAHARIGYNAVVLSDVPSGATAVGVPARNLVKRGASDFTASAGAVHEAEHPAGVPHAETVRAKSAAPVLVVNKHYGSEPAEIDPNIGLTKPSKPVA
jgi:serine O-acetyltransferase